MTVTLDLSEDVSRWVQSMPDGSSRIESALRAIMVYDASLKERYGSETVDRMNRLVEDPQPQGSGDMTDAEFEQSFDQVLSRIAKQLDG